MNELSNNHLEKKNFAFINVLDFRFTGIRFSCCLKEKNGINNRRIK